MTNLTVLPEKKKEAYLTIVFHEDGSFTYDEESLEKHEILQSRVVYALEYIKYEICKTASELNE